MTGLGALIGVYLPAHRRSPKGGRPRIDDRAALTGILFGLKTGIPWEYLPRELGCDGSASTIRSCGVELAWTPQACRHLLAAGIQAGALPIAANSAANTTCWWMGAGFHQ